MEVGLGNQLAASPQPLLPKTSMPPTRSQAQERFPSTSPEPQGGGPHCALKWKLFGRFQQSEALPTGDCRPLNRSALGKDHSMA